MTKLEDQVAVLIIVAPTLDLWKVYVDEASNSRGCGLGIVIFTPIEGLIRQYICITF